MNQSPLPGFEAPVRVASLGSGSRGNGTLVSLRGKMVLIDCGFTLRDACARLRRLRVDPADIAAILVTHEHADHAHGVGALARRFRLPVYASLGTVHGMRDWQDLDVRPFRAGAELDLGGVGVHAVSVPHDAREPTQFVVERDGHRVGVLTDLGHAPRSVRDGFRRCTVLLVEGNHDRELLWRGKYPWPLKQRIASDVGHLSNEQTAEFVAEIADDDLEHLIVGHISEENNAMPLLRRAFARLERRLQRVSYATQHGDGAWIESYSPPRTGFDHRIAERTPAFQLT